MSYLEEFVGSINYLPGEVCRSLELIKLLDETSKSCTEQFTAQSSEYFSSLRKEQGGYLENTELLQGIRNKHQSALSLSEEKVAISKQMLDMVEYHIAKLKVDLDSYKREIYADLDNEEGKPMKKQKTEKNMNLSLDLDLSMYAENDLQDGFDMQADINKTYCYCNKPSYGEMIECEGQKVRGI